MSLMLPDSELDKIGADSNVLGMDCCESCARNIARAQARHMAREIQALRSDYGTLSALEFKEKYGFKEVHNFEKSLFAWLRQEGVM